MKNLIPMIGLVYSLSAFAETVTLTQGLARPESAYIHGDALFISNMSGGGMLKDGIGWIQKLDLKGNVVEEKWIEGLNAPKGLRSDGEKLYTADIDELVIIDLKTKAVEKIKVEGAILLNDVVIDRDGTILISDTWGEKIFRVNTQTKEVSVLMNIDAPNGLLISGETLYVGGFAKPNAMRNGPELGTKGSLMAVNLSTGEQRIVVKDMGMIDGIEEAKDGKLLVTMKDVTTKPHSLNWVDPKTGAIVGALVGVTSFASITDAADLAYDAETGIIYLPNTNSHNVQIIIPE